MAITRLSGGVSPANPANPRTFPDIWNDAAGQIEQAVDDVGTFDGRLTAAEGDITALDGRVTDVEDGKAPLLLEENVQTANYTLALTDSAKVVAVDSSSARTVTVPADATVAFPVGTVVNVYRAGSGSVTVAAAGGVTLRNGGAISDQFGEVSLRKRATNEWVLVGQVD